MFNLMGHSWIKEKTLWLESFLEKSRPHEENDYALKHTYISFYFVHYVRQICLLSFISE